MRLRRWENDEHLEPEYARLLHAIAEHKPLAHYSVILHGSVLWGDRTTLRNGVPISDVDVLVVGEALSDLSAAASALRSIANSDAVSAVPLFKLSVKFRTVGEIAVQQISANELGALMHGRVLVGQSSFEILRPDRIWFYEQASLAVATRLIYVAEQQREIASSSYEWVLSRYLAARLILDIPTVGLLSKGIIGLSYTYRVTTFLDEHIEEVVAEGLPALQDALLTALRTKQDPEGYDCLDIPAAANLLICYSRTLGLIGAVPPNPGEFWRTSRPLDLRDRTLWNISSGAAW